MRRSKKIIPLFLIFCGVFLLVQIVMPIFAYKYWEIGQSFIQTDLISPETSNKSQVLGVSIQENDGFSAIVSNQVRENLPSYTKFYLNVPRLKIEEEAVFLDSNNLERGLAHLPGTAIPGERGNVFISGHSAGSLFFAQRRVVFSKLQDLKKGDEIELVAEGVRFRYQVIGLKVVFPKDLSVIAPPDSSGRYVTLMTCVPPGLNFKRLVVVGKMI